MFLVLAKIFVIYAINGPYLMPYEYCYSDTPIGTLCTMTFKLECLVYFYLCMDNFENIYVDEAEVFNDSRNIILNTKQNYLVYCFPVFNKN